MLKAFGDHLRIAGKPAKVALTACMRKRLTILNAMLTHQTPWQENVVSPVAKEAGVAAGWASKHPSGTTSAEVTAIETAVNCRSAAASPDRGTCTTSAWVVPFQAVREDSVMRYEQRQSVWSIPLLSAVGTPAQWHVNVCMQRRAYRPKHLLIASLASVESHGRGHKPPVSCAQSTISDVWQMGGEQMEVGDTITVAHKSMLSPRSLPAFRRHTPEVQFQLRGMT